VMSGSIKPDIFSNQTKQLHTNTIETLAQVKIPSTHEKPTGSFWPLVRQRMHEKAIKLYMKEHPEVQIEPPLKELRKAGYLQAAKTEALKEIYQERKLIKQKP